MNKHDLQQIRRVSNTLRKYAPHIGEQELTDILCDFGQHGTPNQAQAQSQTKPKPKAKPRSEG